MRLVYGVGINDSDEVTQRFTKDSDGKRKIDWICPYYKKWKYMLERCYSEPKKKRAPTYQNVTICDQWLTFSVFKEWCKDYELETGINIDNFQLDKDIILQDSKIYSPQTCCFVTGKINKFLTDSARSRGDHLLEVSLSRGKYKVTCSDPFNPYGYNRNSKKIFLGRFENEYEAHFKYCECKLLITKRIIEEGLVSYDKRIEQGVIIQVSIFT